ncbi:unnamed protein product [Meganyctiphanes norvegica]|uniref:Uncharacterized protein n=1 Tax=Meganyctiphanes norvegica TaxID=48144 RepID=A0AAV2S1K4_MEGNR
MSGKVDALLMLLVLNLVHTSAPFTLGDNIRPWNHGFQPWDPQGPAAPPFGAAGHEVNHLPWGPPPPLWRPLPPPWGPPPPRWGPSPPPWGPPPPPGGPPPPPWGPPGPAAPFDSGDGTSSGGNLYSVFNAPRFRNAVFDCGPTGGQFVDACGKCDDCPPCHRLSARTCKCHKRFRCRPQN